MQEARVRWSVNGVEQPDLLASPGDERELILGCLCTAGRLRSVEELTHFVLTESGVICMLTAAAERPLPVRSCPETPFAFLQARMRSIDRPVGAHTAALFSSDRQLLIRCDISRHHALNRVVGAALLRRLNLGGCAVTISSRITLSLAENAVRCGLAALQTDKLISDAAVEAAARAGLWLIGRVERGEGRG